MRVDVSQPKPATETPWFPMPRAGEPVPPLRSDSPLAQLQLPEPVTELGAGRWGELAFYKQPKSTYAAGFLLPYGQHFSPERIQQAIDTMGVAAHKTPFAGSILFTPPPGTTVRGGLLLLHGSEGGASGQPQMTAADYAAKGYATLAYSYFGVPGRPQGLGAVSIDDAIAAASWLRRAPEVEGGAVGLVGASRGGEMAALVASFAPHGTFQAVAAHSPQDRAVSSFTLSRDGEFEHVTDDAGKPVPAWTLKGRPIMSRSPIEVERSDAPFLISAGEADDVWSADGVRHLAARLERSGKPVELIMMPGEAHNPGYPVSRWLDRKIDGFLERHLGDDTDQ